MYVLGHKRISILDWILRPLDWLNIVFKSFYLLLIHYTYDKYFHFYMLRVFASDPKVSGFIFFFKFDHFFYGLFFN